MFYKVSQPSFPSRVFHKLFELIKKLIGRGGNGGDEGNEQETTGNDRL